MPALPRSGTRLRLQVAERVDRRAVDPHFEVEVRPEAVAGAGGVTDRLALGDDLAHADGDARLVAVRGRDPTAVVDCDEVPVAGHPARVDDTPRGRRADRSAVADPDVDALVQPTPAPAEPARHGPVHRPDEARG